jgi:hypothetical protein
MSVSCSKREGPRVSGGAILDSGGEKQQISRYIVLQES